MVNNFLAGADLVWGLTAFALVAVCVVRWRYCVRVLDYRWPNPGLLFVAGLAISEASIGVMRFGWLGLNKLRGALGPDNDIVLAIADYRWLIVLGVVVHVGGVMLATHSLIAPSWGRHWWVSASLILAALWAASMAI